MPTPIEQNTTDLQSILTTVNNLPDAPSGSITKTLKCNGKLMASDVVAKIQ